MLTISKNYNFSHYLFIFLLIQITCVPFWMFHGRALDLLLLGLAFYFYYKRNGAIKINKQLFWIFIIYSLVAVIQGFTWSFSIVSVITSFSFTFLLGYLLFWTYRFDFLLLFERVFKILTVISMVIWILQNLLPDVESIINSIILSLDKFSSDEWPRSMFIYTYWPALKESYFSLSRNAGFLHEPGAFAALLTLAIVINYMRGINLLDRRNYFYLAAMLSTVSTVGYLSLCVLFLLLAHQKRRRLMWLFVLPIVLGGAFYAFVNFDFMQKKLEVRYTEETNRSLNDINTSGRIFNARKSLLVLKKYPLFGRGLNTISMPKSSNDPEFAGYGFLSYLSKYGLIAGTIFFYIFFKGIFNFVKGGGFRWYESFVIIVALMINLFSQAYITKPFFFIFFLFGLYAFSNTGGETLLKDNYLKNINF